MTDIPEIPFGAIENGRVLLQRLADHYDFTCEAGALANCIEYHEAVRCFEVIAQFASESTAALPHLSAPCAVEVPEGWQLVPKDPTFEMAKAAIDLDPKSDLDAKYKAMLSAAPQVVTKPVDVAVVRGCAATVAINALQWIVDHPKESNAVVWDLAIDALAAIRALSSEQAQGEQNGITISTLQSAHIERQKEWCPDQQPDLSFRGNEMAGEVGEACNVIKKLERERQGWRGSRSSKEELASELADVIHTAILCAVTAGIDLEAATVEKFNATSVKNGLQTLLPAAPTPEAGK